MQANSSFFIMTISLLSVHLDIQMPLEICVLLRISLAVVILFRGRVLPARMGCSFPFPGKKQRAKNRKGLFLHFKEGKAVWGHNSNVGSRRVFTMQLFLKAFSTLAILHLLSRKFYISYTAIIKSSKEIQGIQISDYI